MTVVAYGVDHGVDGLLNVVLTALFNLPPTTNLINEGISLSNPWSFHIKLSKLVTPAPQHLLPWTHLPPIPWPDER
jgi:hypothetical protein